LYNGTNTEWLRNRAPRYSVAAQALPVASARESTREIVLPAVQWIALLPSWILLAMIVLAATAVCATVIVKARSEFQTSSIQRDRVISEIDSLRRVNGSLQLEIRRLTNDSSTIELAARERLGMVMPSDIVVPVESISSASSLRTVSFVR
jgi:cell division protein FtsL